MKYLVFLMFGWQAGAAVHCNVVAKTVDRFQGKVFSVPYTLSGRVDLVPGVDAEFAVRGFRVLLSYDVATELVVRARVIGAAGVVANASAGTRANDIGVYQLSLGAEGNEALTIAARERLSMDDVIRLGRLPLGEHFIGLSASCFGE